MTIYFFNRNVTVACQSMKEGRWDRKAFSGGSELSGKTLAIIGLGKIGKEVAFRMRAFDMQVNRQDFCLLVAYLYLFLLIVNFTKK